MATWDDVSRLVLGLPEVTEETARGLRKWRVRKKPMLWERPLRAADLDALGTAAPDGPILGARVPGLDAKAALLADGGDVYFTTPHFDGYPTILVRLDNISIDELEEVITEAWLAQAPKPLAQAFLEDQTGAAN